MLAGDRIIRIEGKSTQQTSVNDAVKQLRGEKGTATTITVVHENGKVEDLKIVRDIIRLESVKDAHIVDEKNGIGYLLSRSSRGTAPRASTTPSAPRSRG